MMRKASDLKSWRCENFPVEQIEVNMQMNGEGDAEIPSATTNIKVREDAGKENLTRTKSGTREEIKKFNLSTLISDSYVTPNGRIAECRRKELSVDGVNMGYSRYDPILDGEGNFFTSHALCGTDVGLINSERNEHWTHGEEIVECAPIRMVRPSAET